MEEVQEIKKKKKRKKRRRKQAANKKLSKFGRLFFDGILVLALCVAGYSGYKIYEGLHDYNEGKSAYENIKVNLGVDNVETKIDFDYLKGINPDTAGWIHLDDSQIDYPFVFADNNEYYLNHLFDGEYNRSGCIFMETTNARNFSDKNIVLYGHHMKNGTMFRDVQKYSDQAWYDTHKVFKVSTPDQEYEMYPIAGVAATGSTDYVKTNFEDEEEFTEYVNWFLQNSTFVSEEDVTPEDQLMLLSTCAYHVNDGRYALLGKLVKK